ncbi:LacI family DNA-binding transcriptional regulator [Bosea sp. RAF48]|uniref:LacI family DNA-binding transcriptional regulator n=1 Tax=Bosea sp. RAF48 TaxID=3237480 RepID=UPI003F91DB8A
MGTRQSADEPRPITIKDVASRAGVGLGTASRVLNGNENVAPHLREQVFKAVQDLGYHPNSVARSMRLGKSYAVGCLVTDIRQPIAAEMIAAAENTLRREGYTLIVASTHFDDSREAEILSLLQNRVVDGMLLAVNRDNDPETARRLAAITIPMVLWERSPDGGFDTVLTEHRTGARRATEHLLELGHREIALVAGHLDTWVGREQRAGFDAAFTDRGLEPPAGRIFEVGAFGARKLEALCRGERPITAIIANIDEIPGILHFCAKRGLVLPRDLSIVSIGDASILEVMTPSITAVRGNGTKVAQLAATLLLKKMSDKQPQAASERLSVGMQLKIRHSTAPLDDRGSGPVQHAHSAADR